MRGNAHILLTYGRPKMIHNSTKPKLFLKLLMPRCLANQATRKSTNQASDPATNQVSTQPSEKATKQGRPIKQTSQTNHLKQTKSSKQASNTNPPPATASGPTAAQRCGSSSCCQDSCIGFLNQPKFFAMNLGQEIGPGRFPLHLSF